MTHASVAVRLFLRDGFNRLSIRRVSQAGPGFEGGWLRLGGLLIAWIQRTLGLLLTADWGAERLRRVTLGQGSACIGDIVFSHR